MRVESALDLINALVYKPGWRVSATDHTNRFEGSILVRIDYPARSSNREDAPDYETVINTYATFPLVVENCDDTSLYYKIAQAISGIDVHEMREFLRVEPTLWAPFHPHRIGGMQTWAKMTGERNGVEDDLKFGIA